MIKISDLPKANIPKTDITTSDLKKQDLPKVNLIESDRVSSFEGSIIGKTPTNLDLRSYQKYLGTDFIPTHHGIPAIDEARAQNQSHWEQWRNSLGQLVVSTVLGGAIENIGHMGEIFGIGKIATDTEYGWGQNLFQITGHNIAEWGRESMPVYASARALEGGPKNVFSKGYIPHHMPSIASSIALMVPSYGAMWATTKLFRMGATLAKTMRGATKLAKVGNAVSKAENPIRYYLASKSGHQLGKGIIGSFYSRHTYNYTESLDTYRTAFEEAKELGYNDKDAEEKAAIAAQHMYKLGYLNLWKDAITWGIMLKAGGVANRYLNAKRAAAMGKTHYRTTADKLAGRKGVPLLGEEGGKAIQAIKKPITPGKVLTSWGILGLAEGFEEYNIQWQKKEGIRQMHINMGLEEKGHGSVAEFMDRLREHTKDPHTFDSFLWGTLGGLLFGATSKFTILRAERNQAKATEKALVQLEQNMDKMGQLLNLREQAVESGDLYSANMIDQHIESDLLMRGIIGGDISLSVEWLKTISQYTNEQLEQAGFPKDVQSYFGELASDIDAMIPYFNEQANRNHVQGNPKMDMLIAQRKTYYEFNIRRLERLREQYESEANKIKREADKSNPTLDLPGARSRNANVQRFNKYKYLLTKATRELEKLTDLVTDTSQKLAKDSNNELLIQQFNQHNVSIRALAKQIEDYGKEYAAAEANIKAIDKDLSTAVKNKYLTETDVANIKEVTNSQKYSIENVQETIHDITAQIDNNIKAKIELDTKEGINKLKQEHDEMTKRVEDANRAEFNEALDNIDPTATNALERLDKKHNEFGKEYKDEYNAKKRQIEKHKKKLDAEKEHTSNIDSIIDHLKSGKTVKTLTDKLKSIYEANKKAIKDRLKTEQTTKPEAETKTSTTPKTETTPTVVKPTVEATVIHTAVKDSSASLAILNEDGSVKPYSPDLNMTKAEYINAFNNIYYKIVEAITPLNVKTETLAKYADVATKIGVDIKVILHSILGENYKSTYIDNYDITQVNLNPITVPGASSEITTGFHKYLIELRDHIQNNDLELNVPPPTPKPETPGRAQEFIDSIESATKKLGDVTKHARQLNDPIIGIAEFAKATIAAVENYFTGVKAEVTLADIYDFLLEQNREDLVINNHRSFQNLFNYLNKEFGDKYKSSNEGVIINTKAKPLRGRQKIQGFIREAYVRLAHKPIVSTDSILFINISELHEVKDGTVTSDRLKTLVTAFERIRNGHRVTTRVAPEYNPEGLSEEALAKRNADSDGVPVAIVYELDGTEVDIGYIQSLQQIHNGVPYVKDGEYNPFSSTVGENKAGVISANLRDIQQAYYQAKYNGEVSFGQNEAVERLIKGFIQLNDPNTEITAKAIAHVLEPLYFNISEKSTIAPDSPVIKFTIEEIINKFKAHATRFTSDYIQNQEIRDRINNNEEFDLVIHKKSVAPSYSDTYRFIPNSIKPVKIKGETTARPVVLHMAKNTTADKTLYDTVTGKPINVNRTNAIEPGNFYFISEKGDGTYDAHTMKNNTLDGKYGREIFDNIIVKALKDLAISTNLAATQKQLSDTIRHYIYTGTVNNRLLSVDRDSRSITLAANEKGLHPRIKYNPSTGEFIIGMHRPGSKDTKYTAITAEKLYDDYFKGLKRDSTLDAETKSTMYKGEFTDFKDNTYANFTEFLLNTEALGHNMPVVRDTDGNVLSNYMMGRYPNENMDVTKSPAVIFLKLETPKATPKSKSESKAETAPKVDPRETKVLEEYANKTIEEILDRPEFEKYSSLLKGAIKRLGINLKFNNSISKTEKGSENSLLTVTTVNNDVKTQVINIHPLFYVQNEYNRKYTIIHEILHPILDVAEQNLRAEGKFDNYISKVNEFLNSIEEFVKNDKTILSKEEKTALNNYIAEGREQHSETITYAFGDLTVRGALAKIGGKEVKTEGFWSKLLNIIKDILAIPNSKLHELTALLNEMINIDPTAPPTATKKDTPTTPTKPTTPQGGSVLNQLFGRKQAKLLTPLSANVVWNQNADRIAARYNITEAEFKSQWSELSIAERLQEIKCI